MSFPWFSRARPKSIGEREPVADVGLLLEGTFPYVAGGVSSWVNQIICGFPDLTFAICFLGSRREDYGERKFALPANVTHISEYYLYDSRKPPVLTPRDTDPDIRASVETLHRYFRDPDAHQAEGAQAMELLVGELRGRLNHEQFLYAPASWAYTTDQYQRHCSDPSFVDYFWTVRTMHAPIWTLAEVVEKFPAVRCYHTISTGYAGFLGALLKRRWNRPLILSEHGIYTKERKI
ncbi:MAG: GT4 family glycosyltransferase PelF, partial [Hydrogenophaga sp.]|nr:GT4 family glycosyltransferase PelF [Hydrogenophaga sp.]